MAEKISLKKKYNFNLPRFEYWYDPNPEHLGAIRIIDYKDNKIYGSDPDLPYWIAPFEIINKNYIKIDFHLKKTHKINKILYAKFVNKRRNLNFIINQKDNPIKDKINSWEKIGQNPEILLNLLINNQKKIKSKKLE
jgi:hypothetical protein